MRPPIGALLAASATAALSILLGAAVTAQDRPALDDVEIRHRDALLELGAEASERMLFNDAERLLRTARRWTAEDPGVAVGLAALRERRIALRDEGDYLRFLRASDYERARARLREREAAIAAGTAGELLALLESLRRDGTDPLEAVVVEAALRVHASEAKLRAVLGPERLRGHLEARRRERSIDRLELGRVVAGPDVDLEDLRGKVVLWRSFSL